MGEKKKMEAQSEGHSEGAGEEIFKIEEENLDAIKDALEEKKKGISELQDKYIRLYAEFENFKKVIAKEQAETLKYGHERLITELLSVIDNLERAIIHSKGFIERVNSEGAEAFQGLTSGVEMTLKQIIDLLGRFGVKEIKALGEPFDPSKHHAVSQLESDEYESNTVIEELRKGYYLNDRVIRPSMVVVSKKKEKAETHEAEIQSDKGKVVNIGFKEADPEED